MQTGVAGDLSFGAFQYPGGGVSFDLGGSQRLMKKPKTKSKGPRTKVLPSELDVEGPTSNFAYQTAVADPLMVFAPQTLGFLPSNYWVAAEASFGDLVVKFFQRKNNANCRFPHKLFNALALVGHDPAMYNLIGVQWVTDKIFKVDKMIFGRLLGISSIDGSLFHQQGNFPSHGFGEVTRPEIEQLRMSYDLSDVDQDRVRLCYHKGGIFSKSSNENAVTRCKWITDNQPRL
jgi:hypothetical protein